MLIKTFLFVRMSPQYSKQWEREQIPFLLMPWFISLALADTAQFVLTEKCVSWLNMNSNCLRPISIGSMIDVYIGAYIYIYIYIYIYVCTYILYIICSVPILAFDWLRTPKVIHVSHVCHQHDASHVWRHWSCHKSDRDRGSLVVMPQYDRVGSSYFAVGEMDG